MNTLMTIPTDILGLVCDNINSADQLMLSHTCKVAFEFNRNYNSMHSMTSLTPLGEALAAKNYNQVLEMSQLVAARRAAFWDFTDHVEAVTIDGEDDLFEQCFQVLNGWDDDVAAPTEDDFNNIILLIIKRA